MVQISRALQLHGLSVFVPHADGMEFRLVCPAIVQRGFTPEEAGEILHQAIFALDVYQVVAGCGSLVLNLNGRVPDEGAVAEATMAWMLGKPVAIYKEDRRSLIAGRDNPLVVGQGAFRVFASIDELARGLVEQIGVVDPSAAFRPVVPPHVAQAVCAGERLWLRMQAEGALPGAEERIAEVIVSLFASDRRSTVSQGNGHRVSAMDELPGTVG